MIKKIGSVDKVAGFVKAVKDGTAGTRLMGFGIAFTRISIHVRP